MLPPPAPPLDPAVLLSWAARVRECGQVAHEQGLALRGQVEHSGLAGPAGDALAQLGGSVAAHLGLLADRAAVAADALVRAAHEAALVRDAGR